MPWVGQLFVIMFGMIPKVGFSPPFGFFAFIYKARSTEDIVIILASDFRLVKLCLNRRILVTFKRPWRLWNIQVLILSNS